MISVRQIVLPGLLCILTACTTTAGPTPATGASNKTKLPDNSIRWTRDAAEYRALSLQAYAAATEDLDRFVADKSWSALPFQQDAKNLPPAIILDVDETVVSNVEFQLSLKPPFSGEKHNRWSEQTKGVPIPGVVTFLEKARAAGVSVFFVTNRPCEPKGQFPCKQRQITIDDIQEAGIPADAEHVYLSDERGWTREKRTRRAHIAETHRVIMLFGDNLGDFLPCIRKKIHTPCTEAASRDSRHRATIEHSEYWGEGWYVLPNPMYGSWTRVD